MARTKKLIGIAAVGLVVLVLIAGIALSIDYDSPVLGQALLRQASAVGGLELEAEGFRLNLLQGLELEKVKVRSALEGGRLSATAEKLVLAHRLGPLLRGEVQVDEIVLVRPSLELVSSEVVAAQGAAGQPETPRATGEATAEGAGASSEDGTGLKLRIERFAIVDGTLITRVEDGDEPPTELRGLDLELRQLATDASAASMIQGLAGEGELTARELLAGDTRATDVEGLLRLEDGHLWVTDCRFETDFGGLVLSELELDLNHDPYRFQMALGGDPIETHPFLGGDGGGFGSGKLDFRLGGDLSETMNLDGAGALAVNTGNLPPSEILEALESLLRLQLVGQEHGPFEVRFEIDEERVLAETFRIVVGDVELAFGGGAGLFDEKLSLQLAAIAPRASIDIEEIPEEVLEALTDVDGRVNLPIAISGTMTEPKIHFDRSAWGQLARRRLEKEAQKELAKGLGRLLGTEDEDD